MLNQRWNEFGKNAMTDSDILMVSETFSIRNLKVPNQSYSLPNFYTVSLRPSRENMYLNPGQEDLS